MNMLVPLMIAVIFLTAVIKRVDILEAFVQGARENLLTAFELCSVLILLMTAISMFSGSGLAEAAAEVLEVPAKILGFPPECTQLMLIRPISGSGSLVVLEKILSENPPDSFAARTACVMMGATETTLYTIAVYFGAAKAKATASVFAASLIADIAGFLFASLITKLCFFT